LNREYFLDKQQSFKGMNNLVKEIAFKGTIKSGSGRGKRFVNLPWAKKQFQEKLGFNPYPGTLNLHLPKSRDLEELKKAEGIRIIPEKGYEEGHCFRALVMGKVWGAVVVLDFPGYPPDLLEVMAPVNLRQTLELQDGMDIEVTVKIE
jgi:riboflavin kinase